MTRTPRRHPSAFAPHLETLETRDTPATIGSLDPSFGTAGISTILGVPIADIAVQADGKIVAVGSTGAAGARDFFVGRFNANGTIDTTFNVTGQRTIDMGGANDTALAVAVQANGRIVIVGTSDAGGTNDFAIARLNADGSTDTSLNAGGTPGRLLVDLGGNDIANALVIQSDTRILVAGAGGAAADFAVIRLNSADGTLDTTLNGTGAQLVDFGAADQANAVAVQSDGRIVLAGSAGPDIAIARLTTGGLLDASFDGDGRRTIDAGGGADTANAVVIQSDGRIVLAGDNGADIVAFRLLSADGSSDNTFGTAGRATIDLDGTDNARAAALQPDGKIVLVGDTGAPDITVIRLNTNGSIDQSFGTAGAATFDSGGNDFGNAVELTPTGRILVGGSSGADGAVLRLIGRVEDGLTLVVSGETNAQALVFRPNFTTGQYTTTPVATLSPFSTFVGNVRTATGDVNGDGVPDTILVTGPGTRIGFAVVDGRDNTTLLVPPTAPFAGSESFTGGGFVAAGDLDGDGRAEIFITPDQGGGPRVTIFSLVEDGVVVRSNFLGIDDANFRGGARPAIGDVDGDGVPDLAVAAGFLGGPRVAVFNGATLLNNPTRLLNDFFAFPGDDATSLRNGAFVTAGDINGDGFADLIFGGGPGGAPRVFILSGQLLSLGIIANVYNAPIANFFVAGNQNDRGGVRVAAVDADGDNRADLSVGSGERVASNVRVYLGRNFVGNGSEPGTSQTLNPYNGAILTGGVFVG